MPSAFLVAGLMFFAASAMPGQTPAPRLSSTAIPATHVADSAAVHAVTFGAIRMLASRIAQAKSATQRQPWIIHVPDSTQQYWRSARDTLFSLLHARAAVPADGHAAYMELGPIGVSGDSLITRLAFGEAHYCKGIGWTASGGAAQFVAIRQGGKWSELTVGKGREDFDGTACDGQMLPKPRDR